MSGVEDRAGHLTGGDLLAWHDGQLDASETVHARDHLAECAECRRELRSLRDDLAWTSEKLESLDVEPDPARRPGRARRGTRHPRLATPLSAAVVLVVIIGSGLMALAPGGLLRGWLEGSPVDTAGPGALTPQETWTERLATPAPESLTILIEGSEPTEIEIVRTRDDAVAVLTRTDFPLGRLEMGGDRLVVNPGQARRVRVRIPIASSARVLHGSEVLVELPSVPYPDSSTILVVGNIEGARPR